MCIFYYYYKNILWSVYSDAPVIGNIAFPDFSVTYYVSFMTEPNIEISGVIPSNVNFFSITVYDTNAKTIHYFDDSDVDQNIFYSFTLNNLPYVYAIIVRYYLQTSKDTTNRYCNSNSKPNIADFSLPKITSSKTLKEFPFSTQEQRIENTNTLSSYYTYFSKRRSFQLQDNYDTFKSPINPLQMYFPNKKASYSSMRVKSVNDVIIIRGKMPHIARSTNMRYIGFMLCNYMTTETDNSIGNERLNKEYVLFIASMRDKAAMYGYNKGDKTHALLLWNQTNEFPLIVYREVKITNDDNYIPDFSIDVYPNTFTNKSFFIV